MALTLEAALVFPLSISFIIGLVPPAVHDYRRIAGEAAALRQAARLAADPKSIYFLQPLSGSPPAGQAADGAAPPGAAAGGAAGDVLLTSPKLMFALVTAVLDDLQILGLKP